MVDSIIESVREKLQQRAWRGIKKYRVTMDRTDLSQLDWLGYAQEEMLDGAVYLEKLIQSGGSSRMMVKRPIVISDLDHPLWIVASGSFIVVVSLLALFCNYSQWETPKDLLTVSQIAAAYFAAAVAKRIVRLRQRRNREES